MSKEPLVEIKVPGYDGFVYREIARQTLCGLRQLIDTRTLPTCYRSSFRQGGEIYRLFLLGVGYYDHDESCTTTDIEEAQILTAYLQHVAEKYAAPDMGYYDPDILDTISETLFVFADGSEDIENYSTEYFQIMYDLFRDLWEMLDKDCNERKINFPAWDLVTQAPEMTQ